MDKNRFLTRFVAAPLVVAVAVGGSLLLSGAANANPAPGSRGTLTFAPTTGLDTQIITATTSQGCDSQSNAADLEVTGPIGAATPTFPPRTVITSTESNTFSTTSSFQIPEGTSLKDAASVLHTTIQPGEYDFTVVCQDQTFLTEFGTFTGAIFFTDPTHYNTGATPTPTATPTVTPTATPTVTPTATPTVTPTATPTVTPTATPTVTPTATPTVTPTATPTVTPTATPTPVPGAKATTTTLSVIQVPLPFGLGGFAIPIANVGPDNPAGTVQFKDGTHNLGDPVRVFGGVAVGPFAFLPPGHHSVTAVFTPTNPAKFKPSTSNTVNFTF